MTNQPWIAKNVIVTLDFDGCIAIGDFLKIKYAKILHGVDISQEQCSKEKYPYPYPDPHLSGLTREQRKKLSDEDKKKVEENSRKYLELMNTVATDYIFEYQLDPQCKKVLNTLHAQGFRFAIVTSREKQLLEACKRFVKFHKLPISYFHGTGSKETKYISKDFFVKKLRSRAMIDDTLYKLMELKDTPAQLFFLVRPWSEYELKNIDSEIRNRITVIRNWNEFKSCLLYMKELYEAICYSQGWKNDYRAVKDIFNFWRLNKKLCEEYFKMYKTKVA